MHYYFPNILSYHLDFLTLVNIFRYRFSISLMQTFIKGNEVISRIFLWRPHIQSLILLNHFWLNPKGLHFFYIMLLTVVESIGDTAFLKRLLHGYLQHFLSNCWHLSGFDGDAFLSLPEGVNKRFSEEIHSFSSDGL